MLKYYNYDIVFQEIPEEVTLAVNLTGCPNRCQGCHSPHLQQDIGEPLTQETIAAWLKQYRAAITCFCLMGGDARPAEVSQMAQLLKTNYPNLKTAWYSGRDELSQEIDIQWFDYVKVGRYDETRGSLKNQNTNQRLYEIQPNGGLKDVTERFRRR